MVGIVLIFGEFSFSEFSWLSTFLESSTFFFKSGFELAELVGSFEICSEFFSSILLLS